VSGRVGGCGQIGDALLDRLRPSNEAAAQFSVGFISVLAGCVSPRRSSRMRSAAPETHKVSLPPGLFAADARFVTKVAGPSERAGRDPPLRA
jgi:hypothetical protein